SSFARPEFFKQVESIGTVLSIDWKDVGAMKIESTLHNDLALKT
ncbi:unnamed protein product, partial [Brassica oleracea var. botrytis]